MFFFRCLLTASTLVAGLSGCVDSPTDVGSSFVPGTDSIYSLSSDATPLFDSARTVVSRVPVFNNTFTLLGRTADSEARMLIEFINWPGSFGGADTFDVLSARIRLMPGSYMWGDTVDNSFSFRVFELTKEWSALYTWDSLFRPDGSSDHYDASQSPLAVYSGSLPAASDTAEVYVDLPPDIVKKWLVMGSDSSTARKLYGLALHPVSSSFIRLFRNYSGSKSEVRMDVVTRHRDSVVADTFSIFPVVAGFANTPDASSGETVIQGARKLHAQYDVNLSALPANAVIIGGNLRLHIDVDKCKAGTFGIDEVFRLELAGSSGGRRFETYAWVDRSTWSISFPLLASPLQSILAGGGKGSVAVIPNGSNGVNELWRINRIYLHSLSASPQLRPKLDIIYALPKVKQ